MSGTDRVAKKRERRIIQRSREREEMFVSDYVKQKYPDIHAEAVQVYELLAKKYPDKADVRKTIEHKAWKITSATILHPAFDTQQAPTIPILAQMKLVFPQLNTEPLTIPEYPAYTEPLTAPTPEPQASTEPPTPEPQASTEPPTPEPQASTEPPTPEPQASTEPPTPEPQASTEPPNPPKSTYADNMRLVIPLLKPPVKHPGIITKTLEIVTEETLQGDQHPTTMEQFDPEILDKLIGELRADPDLKDIFADIELQFEQGMDIDIDIDTDTRLEDQLENWEFW